MSEYPASVQSALKWIRDHGGDCAVARVNGGGRIYLAQGETGPFLPSTARKMIDLGLAEYVDMNGKKAVRARTAATLGYASCGLRWMRWRKAMPTPSEQRNEANDNRG